MPEQPEVRADDPYGGRPPTVHEQRAGQPWNASYLDGPAPWDIGGPQPAVMHLASEGAFTGAVLDAGCGTGDNALHIAALGVPVLGFDVAETALSIARKRAAERCLDAEFVLADALRLDDLVVHPASARPGAGILPLARKFSPNCSARMEVGDGRGGRGQADRGLR